MDKRLVAYDRRRTVHSHGPRRRRSRGPLRPTPRRRPPLPSPRPPRSPHPPPRLPRRPPPSIPPPWRCRHLCSSTYCRTTRQHLSPGPSRLRILLSWIGWRMARLVNRIMEICMVSCYSKYFVFIKYILLKHLR